MITGNDILAYKGNADQGIGTDVAALGSGVDNLANFNHVQSQILAQDYAWNTMQYQQKVKDRDDTATLMSQQDIDVDVDDKDRPDLQNKLNEIQDLWIQNPDLKSNPDAYMQVKKKIQEFNGMKVSAKTRAVELKKMDLEYANNPDAEDRARQGKWIQDQRDKGIYHMVDPYQKEQSFDLKNVILPVVEVPTVTRHIGKDGIAYKTTTKKPDIDDMFNKYAAAAVEGEGKNIPNQWAAYYEHAKANPDFMSDKNLLAMNNKLAEINKAEKWNEGNPRYRYPVAVKDGDGNWQLKANPFDLALDTKLVNDYDGNPVTEVDKDYQKAMLTREQTNKEKSIAQLNRAKGITEVARRNALNAKASLDAKHGAYYNALIDKVGKEGTVLDDKHKKMVAEGMGPVAQSIEAFNSAHQDTRTISDVSQLGANLRKEIGVDPGWSYSDLPANDPRYKKLLGVPRYGGESSFTSAGKFLGADYPDRIMVVRPPDGSLNGTKIVGLDKDGKGGWKIHKVSDLNTAYVDIIQDENGYKKTDKTVALENSSRLAIQLGQGSQAAGFDGEAFIKNLGVVTPVKDESLPEDDKDEEDEADTDNEDGEEGEDNEDGEEAILPMSNFSRSDVIRENGKPKYVKVQGVKKPIIAIDRKTGLVKFKK